MDSYDRNKGSGYQRNGAPSGGEKRKDIGRPSPKNSGRGNGDGPSDYYLDRDRYGDKRDRRGKSEKIERKSNVAPAVQNRQKDSKSPGKADYDKKKEEEEKLKKEEEEQQREELQQKEEEERQRQEKERIQAEEEQRIKDEELKLLHEFIEDINERNKFKDSMKENNAVATECRPDEAFFSKLDSSLKKNTAFVKKLRNMTDSQKESLIKEFSGLNLTKYIGEVAAAIADTKLKMSDIQCAVHVCSLLHQRYAEFAPSLLDNLQKYLLSKKEEKISNLSKYRVDLRFLGELISVGVFTAKEGLPVLANQLSILVNSDREEHNHLSIISSFCKHLGDDYVGLISRKYRILAEKYDVDIPRSQVLPPERQKACRNLLKEYYQSLCKHLVKSHKEMKTAERQNRRILQTKGELSQERREMFENMLINYQKLYISTATFADLLDEDVPDLPDDEFNKDENGAMFDIFNPTEFQYEGDATLFEDEDTRSFYETLPDLRAFIPGILYKDSEQKDGIKSADPTLDEDLENLEVEDLEREIETEQQIAEEEEKILIEKGQKAETPPDLHEPDSPEDNSFNAPEADEEDNETGSLMRSQFESYLQSLPNCVNRDLIDKAAIEFCMNFNTKSNRKKLVKALFSVHRTRYDLLPFYARLIATLNPCMPDLATELLSYLKGDFKWHVRKKDQINIESKLKIVRFIGELVKFKMCPKVEALQCLKMLMFDFSHHNIEMACSLLETCGRFLYRSPDSHHRTKVYLDVMMRKKAALHLDVRYQTMIENAYFYCNPPEMQQIARKLRPPLFEYIRKLLYKELSKVTTEKILRQMRKLDWDEPEIAFYATKCLVAVWNVRYNSIHCAANVLAGLAPYHEQVAIQVVDGVLEDIRLGMENNHPRYNQRRVSCVKYLGELYNYRMVESSVIFKTLYSLITFGVVYDENPSSDSALTSLDPPEHLFRIRLVCVLLETCGQYFNKGSSKKKLDCFLVYFQRYYWFKRSSSYWTESHPFPVDVENLIIDTLEIVRPKMKLFESYEECCKAAEALENEYKSKLGPLLSIVDTGEDGETSLDGDGLPPIQESDEFSHSDELSQGLQHMTLDERLSETSQGSEHTHSQTGSHSMEDAENMGSSSCGDGDDDVLESAGEDESEDQVTILTGGPKHIHCQEDDDFMTAFDKMMAENFQARTQESLKVPQLDIAVPMHLMGKTKKISTVTGGMTHVSSLEENISLTFVLMTKRGNKQQFTNLKVPISEEFATKFQERKEQERIEKEKMKQVVLGIHERQEEEDYQEMLASLNRPVPVNTNRERRVRYQHPKGAPDADLIFGSK